MKQEYDFSEGVRGKFYREGAEMRYPSSDDNPVWAGPTGRLGTFIVREVRKCLKAYREQPKLAIEHARSERDTADGGYASRQLFELVQNSADALLESAKAPSILIRLTDEFLYCADGGKPVDEKGVEGLMFDRMSSKRSTNAIGRFGRGFKSILRVTDAPEFFSRSGSFRFDKARAEKHLAKVAPVDQYPVLRLPEPFDPCVEKDKDEELQELMSWATNIVRLPLRAGARNNLAQQVRDFPPEFLLFADHVRYLTLEDGEYSRSLMLHRRNGNLWLDSGEGASRWLRFDITHRLSATAQADWDTKKRDVRVSWAAPLDRLDRHGHFWAYFPTNTASLVAGILNAPWKTNEDRQNLLPGPYNEEVIEAAAGIIVKALPQLATNADPARHLDALPRRHERGDSKQADLLREHLFSGLKGCGIVPDQDGQLRVIGDISYPPRELTESSDKVSLEQWASYVGRPRDWLHHRALTRNRLAAIDRLFFPQQIGTPAAPRATIANWLEALVKNQEGEEAVRASMAAVQTAAAIPVKNRSQIGLGYIVLTAEGSFQRPNPEHIFLPESSHSSSVAPASCVHPKLISTAGIGTQTAVTKHCFQRRCEGNLGRHPTRTE